MPGAAPSGGWRRLLIAGRGRWLAGGFALAFCALGLLPDPGLMPALRHGAFDAYQVLMPRERVSGPVVIVAIDDDSLARLGQWPWARDRMAVLVERIAAQAPAVIALDVLFAEPDRASPEWLASRVQASDPELAQRLQALPGNDALFAEAVSKSPVVVGMVGSEDDPAAGIGFTPSRLLGQMPPLHRYRGAKRNLEAIDVAARGRGLFNAYEQHGVVRQVPLVAMVGGNAVLSLPMESFRVAADVPLFDIDGRYPGRPMLSVGDLKVPMQDNGSLWLHYAGHDPARFVSAADVLEGDPASLDLGGRIVLVGVTGLGLVDQPLVPGRARMPGVEVHAEAIENLFDGAWLQRPAWARWIEALAFGLLAVVAIIWAPRISPRRGLLLFSGGGVLMLVLALAAFHYHRLLFDPLTPLLGVAALQAMLGFAGLLRMDAERRELSARLVIERERAARVAGELEAAQRIQTGMLPRPEIVLADERRVELHAHMRTAREVGGDLYDFFRLDGDRLFVMVGDVAGKGLPAALFMAVSKAITKSTTLRGRIGLERLVAIVDRELSRDNPEQLFVTMMVSIIELDSGRVEYCNAGHEPLLLLRADGRCESLDEGGGPPLCVVEDGQRRTAEAWLRAGDLLVFASDGLPEAMSPEGALYGRDALQATLGGGGELAALAGRALAAVREFEAGNDPADDQTLLLLRWKGRPQPGRGK